MAGDGKVREEGEGYGKMSERLLRPTKVYSIYFTTEPKKSERRRLFPPTKGSNTGQNTLKINHHPKTLRTPKNQTNRSRCASPQPPRFLSFNLFLGLLSLFFTLPPPPARAGSSRRAPPPLSPPPSCRRERGSRGPLLPPERRGGGSPKPAQTLSQAH